MSSVYKDMFKTIEPHVATAQRATNEITSYLKRNASLVVELTDEELKSLNDLVELATEGRWSAAGPISGEIYKRDKEKKEAEGAA